MDLEQALSDLNSYEVLPRAAFEFLRENWDEVVDPLLQRLDEYVAAEDRLTDANANVLAVIYLLAEHRETRAFPKICQTLLLERDVVAYLYGDALTEHVPGILISTFDGNGTTLRSIVESEQPDPWVRCMVLPALAHLVASGQCVDVDMTAFLRELKASIPTPSPLWNSWAATVAYLGLEQLREEVQTLFDRRLIDSFDMGRGEFEELLEMTLSDPTGMAALRSDNVGPLTDGLYALGTWYHGPTYKAAKVEVAPRPLGQPKIGRNQPCPCGSGKKYKVCCLKS